LVSVSPEKDAEAGQAEYSVQIAEFLMPKVAEAIRALPPPNGTGASGMAGFLQAFAHISLSIAVGLKIHLGDLANAYHLIAFDIEAHAAEVDRAGGGRPDTEATPQTKVDF